MNTPTTLAPSTPDESREWPTADPITATDGNTIVVDRYLDLMKTVLTRFDLGDDYVSYVPRKGLRTRVYDITKKVLATRDLEIVTHVPFDPKLRENGLDWPTNAETMVGLKRLNNLQYCLVESIKDKIPGDFIETGVWRGGSCIFARAVFEAFGQSDRNVWVADSFRGLPPAEADRIEDVEDALHTYDQLAISMDTVRANFERYNLLDDHVKFLPGWFQDTLPSAPIEKISVLRLDGDMYDSTMVALDALYAKVSPGGFIIVDDYDAVRGCRMAVEDFRTAHNIREPLVDVDWTCKFWRKAS